MRSSARAHVRASIRAPEFLFYAKLTLVIRPRPSKYLTCANEAGTETQYVMTETQYEAPSGPLS